MEHSKRPDGVYLGIIENLLIPMRSLICKVSFSKSSFFWLQSFFIDLILKQWGRTEGKKGDLGKKNREIFFYCSLNVMIWILYL